ncbi:MAG: putative Ig domain-containing protein, partial [Desulfuromonadales bacterium]
MGTVTDLSSSAKLAAATVTISSGSTQTDTSGNFIFDPQPANGVYTVTITKSGYSTVTINNVIVSDTAGATLTVGMAPTGILNFTTASGPLLHAETGVAYNQAVKITGGVGPYIFSKAYGTLPSGLALNPELATISGTPTTAGNYTFAVGVTDKLGAYAEREFSIEVTIPFVVTSAPLPRGTIGTAYSSSLTASGGKTPYSYSVTSGSLPSGLTLTAATGSISGKPTTAGTYTFTVQVADASSRTTSQSFTILVDAALSNTTGRLNDGIVGTPFTQTFTATGGLTPYTWGVYSGLLPMGLTLNPTTGIITGTPVFSGAATSSNTLPFVISLQDSYGRVVYRQFAINVLNPLLILTSSMPNGLVSTPYSEAIRTSGGTGPYSFSLTGQLPPGLSINATTGIISGTPSATGLTNLQVTVTDSTWPTAQTKSQNLSIRVTSSVTITTGAVLTNAKKGTAITPVTLAAKGGTPAYSWSIVGGALPSGLALDPASGIISG